PDLMFRVSIDGRYVDYRAPSEWDLLDKEVIGKTVWQRLPEDLAERIMAAGRSAVEERRVQAFEYHLDFGDDMRHFEARLAASGDDEFVLIVRNITDRKVQEHELQASRARIVAAGDAERRRLERNLHDGPQQLEAAAYYVVSEALANVAKYAQASSVRVTVAQLNGSARVEVSDDGVGGADPAQGSGLRGLADRVAALNGTLEVVSPPGRGTRIRAEIPLG